MRRIKTCTLVLSVAVISAALWGCGRPAAEAGPEAGKKDQATQQGGREAEAAAERAEPPPPADYVRSRCTVCSCRAFAGDEGICSRPSCHHGWKDHRSRLKDQLKD